MLQGTFATSLVEVVQRVRHKGKRWRHPTGKYRSRCAASRRGSTKYEQYQSKIVWALGPLFFYTVGVGGTFQLRQRVEVSLLLRLIYYYVSANLDVID